PAAGQGGIDRLPAIAAILMSVCASIFENVAAEFVLRLLRKRRLPGVDLTGLRRNRAQIGDESAGILRRQILQTVLDRFCHRSRGGTAALRVGRGEKACKLRIRPGADAKAFVGGDVISAPTYQDVACELATAFQPIGQIARCVTFATMADRGG